MKKYCSIENYSDAFIAKIREQHPEVDDPWCMKFVATEKIDGVNFGIVCNNGNISFQSRNQELTDSSDFYNFQEALELDGVIEKIKAIPNFDHYILFGEVYGNNVQKRIPYSPYTKIAFFDVYDTVADRYWDWGWFFLFCCQHNLPHTPLIKKGTFQECLDIDVANIRSIASDRVNPPVLEGVVIRPFAREIMMGQTRLIIKKKNTTFGEKAPKTQQQGDTFCLNRYINENRVISAMSKFPENAENKDIILEITDDVSIEYSKDNGAIPEDTLKQFQKKVAQLAGPIVARIKRERCKK